MTDFSIIRGNIPLALILFAVVFAVVYLSMGAFGKGGAGAVPAADTMLVDYYCAERNAEDSRGYSEMVLYTTADKDKLKLCVYSKTAEADDESCTEYAVDAKAARDCFEIIEKHRLDRWNSDENTVSADGVLIVCKYLEKGEYIRVSTESMPADGEAVLRSIGDVMAGYIS